MYEIGVYKNIEEGKKIIFFEGMSFGQHGLISPTDIDGAIEYGDRAWLIYEVKKKGTSVPQPQELMLERFARDMHRAGKDSIVIVAEHDKDTERINLKDCPVRKYLVNDKKWKYPKKPVTTKALTDWFIYYVDKKGAE